MSFKIIVEDGQDGEQHYECDTLWHLADEYYSYLGWCTNPQTRMYDDQKCRVFEEDLPTSAEVNIWFDQWAYTRDGWVRRED